MYWSYVLIIVSILILDCRASSSGLMIPPTSQTSLGSVLSTNYCLRRRALQPGVACVTQSETSTMLNSEPTVPGSILDTSSDSEHTSSDPEHTPTSSDRSSFPTSAQDVSSSVIATSTSGPARSSASPTPNPDVGTPVVTNGPFAPSTSPTVTPGPTTTSTQFTWVPKMTSGSVTVETVTYNFNLLFSPSPKPEKDGKSSKEQAHSDFFALVPNVEKAGSIFDNLGSTFAAFSSAVKSPGATDDSVSKAGAGLLGFFTSAFSVAADIGTDLASIGISELDDGEELLNRFKQAQVAIFDFGTAITNIEPLLSSSVNIASGNTILGYTEAIVGGIGIGQGLKELVDLAKKTSDTRPSPEPTSEPGPESTPEATTQSTPTTNPSSSLTSTSTSSSASASETVKLWAIATKSGTSIADFEAFILGFPDAGRGLKIAYPSINYQVYGSFLTQSQADSLLSHPLVDTVDDNSFFEESDDYSVIPKILQMRGDPDPYPMLNLQQQPISPSHLNLISEGPRHAIARGPNFMPDMLLDYLLSPKAGDGITIFVIDTGLNPFHEDFINSYDPDDYYIVPNSMMGLVATMQDRETHLPVDYIPDSDRIMSESRNHGSCIASLAAGKVYGVAKKAHLVPVKYKNSRGAATPMAIQNAFQYVIDRVSETNNGNRGPVPPPGWAVINFSQGFNHLTGDAWIRRRNLMDKLLQQCWDNDIVTVIAAGNSGEKSNFDLSKDIPACLGSPSNPLITVGASTLEGNRWSQTTRDHGLGGSITTSAQGDEQVRCVHEGAVGSQLIPGTSFAAPQIAGLAAYFMSLSQVELPEALYPDTATTGSFTAGGLSDGHFIGPDLHIKGTVSQAVKDYIVRLTYKRNPNSPDSVGIAYNGAEEGLCKVVTNDSLKRKRGGITPRADAGDLVPVVVSGVMVPSASYPLPACPKPTSSSSTGLSSSPAATSTATSISALSSAVSNTVSSISSTQSEASTSQPATATTPKSSTESPSVEPAASPIPETPIAQPTTSTSLIPPPVPTPEAITTPAVVPPAAIPATPSTSTTSTRCTPGPVQNGQAAPGICL